MRHTIRPDAAAAGANTDEPMDDLMTGLAKARRKGPLLNRVTGTLLGLVLLVGGFLAGVQVQQDYGTSTTGADAGAGRPNGFPAGGQMPGGFPGGQGTGSGTTQDTAGQAVTGKVKLVDGTTVYIETADGEVVTVKTSDTTTVQTATKTELAKIAAGTEVTVQATAQNDTLTATSIIAAK